MSRSATRFAFSRSDAQRLRLLRAGVLALCLAVLGSACAGDPSGWKRVISPDGVGSVAVPAAFEEGTEKGALVLRGDGLAVTLHSASRRPATDIRDGLRVQLEALPGAIVEAREIRIEDDGSSGRLVYHVRYEDKERLQVAEVGEGGVLHLAVFGPGPWDADRSAMAGRIVGTLRWTESNGE